MFFCWFHGVQDLLGRRVKNALQLREDAGLAAVQLVRDPSQDFLLNDPVVTRSQEAHGWVDIPNLLHGRAELITNLSGAIDAAVVCGVQDAIHHVPEHSVFAPRPRGYLLQDCGWPLEEFPDCRWACRNIAAAVQQLDVVALHSRHSLWPS